MSARCSGGRTSGLTQLYCSDVFNPIYKFKNLTAGLSVRPLFYNYGMLKSPESI